MAYSGPIILVLDSEEETASMEIESSDEESDVEVVENVEPVFIIKSDEEEQNTAPASPEQIQTSSEIEVRLQHNEESNNEKFKCPVCLTSFENLTTLAISCGHVFCDTCIDSLAKYGISSCPVCTRRFRKVDSRRIYL